MEQVPGPYLDLAERCVKLDRRNTRYRFDLEHDIPWDRCAEAGAYFDRGLVGDLGVDVAGLAADPEALSIFEWGFALGTCLEFIELERGIVEFAAAERVALGPVRSLELLVEEEHKHIELFIRYADRLRAERPELVAPLERAFHADRGAPFDDRARYPDDASYHYTFWLSTLFFEDYTIYLHERMASGGVALQPAWLAAHAMHRREEEQHVVTDVAHIEACSLDDAERARWSRLSYLWLSQQVARFIGIDAPERLVRDLFPHLSFAPRAPFAATGLHRDLLGHRSFRRTRAAWPYLQQLASERDLHSNGLAPPEREEQRAAREPAPWLRQRWSALRHTAGRALASVTRAEPTVEHFDLRAARAAARIPTAPPPPRPAPTGDLQLETIRLIWARALELPVERIGDDDTFASLGGDSLQAVDIHTALEQHLGRVLAADVLLECRTVRDFANYLSRGDRPAAAARVPPSVRATTTEPIASIGMAARLPGAADLDTLWEHLARGDELCAEVPAARWDGPRYLDASGCLPGTTVCIRGGFLTDIDATDAAALGISEREAEASDPQQRLFLELASDVLEAAGGARGRVGVFASAGSNEYFAELRKDPALLDAHAALGNLHNMVAARVAQVLGLRGPALTLDAACASSHLAIHLACRSLRAGECDLAIAGAAQLNLSPVPFIAFSQAGVLSRTQRCRPFSAQADGFVPGEGAGVVLLKPLSRARADGDDILALVLGSAVNNDGGALSGMAPSPRGQIEVLRAAYADAGVSPDTVDLIEAHGTGTSIGDAVEVQALAQVVGKGPRRCALGSIKSNIGHTLTAAGIASVIKVVLALRHEALPPLSGCNQPSQRIGFERFGVYPLQRLEPWPRDAATGPRRAGITGLGIGGTNVHLVLEEAPESVSRPAPHDVSLAVVSAPTEAELARVATIYAERLEGAAPERELASINRRAHRFVWRRAIVAPADQLAARLRDPGRAARAGDQPPRVGFVFSGPGSQYAGMARPLHDTAPVFREALARCGRILAGHLPRPLEAYLYDVADGSIDRIEIAQPVVFSVGFALAEWLRSLGVTPAVVLGHSAGEYIAACVAGALRLEQALALVARRGAAMSRTRPGKMAAVFAGETRVRAAVDLGPELGFAAINEPDQVVISGDSDALDRALAALGRAGIGSHELAISCAAHSALMAPAQRELEPVARGMEMHPLALPFFSSVSGTRLEPGAVLDARYWIDHLRAPVRFADAVTSAIADVDVLLEVGASGSLVPCIQHTAPSAEAVPLLRRSLAQSWEPALTALGRLVELGVPVDLRRFETDAPAASSYPYRRTRLWLTPATTSEPIPVDTRRWHLTAHTEVHAGDHLAAGRAIAPGARLMELALEHLGERPIVLTDLINLRPLSVSDGDRIARITSDASGNLMLESRPVNHAVPVVHFRARRGAAATPARPLDLAALRARCPRALAPALLYDLLAATGMSYGQTMKTVTAVDLGERELLATLEARDDRASDFHPAVVDGAMQAIAGFFATVDNPGAPRPMFLGFSVARLTVHAAVPRRALAHIELAEIP
ncbi:MAG TPA: beta-ketoacyl synthase N-terminal-like domain-containing protein, partial [Kofleriaceae bacterium]|nr:beta-ketoacyl synthase N-terminal-like domain-containing protein [Kofleriaceae bacterium]